MAKKKTAEQPVPEANVVYIAQHQVRYDGDLYQRGEEIEMSEAQAAPLVASGTLKLLTPTPATPATEE